MNTREELMTRRGAYSSNRNSRLSREETLSAFVIIEDQQKEIDRLKRAIEDMQSNFTLKLAQHDKWLRIYKASAEELLPMLQSQLAAAKGQIIDLKRALDTSRLCTRERDEKLTAANAEIERLEKCLICEGGACGHFVEAEKLRAAIEATVELADFLNEAAERGAGFGEHWGERVVQTVEALRDINKFKDQTLQHNRILLNANGRSIEELTRLRAELAALKAAFQPFAVWKKNNRYGLYHAIDGDGLSDGEWEVLADALKAK